MRCSPHVSPDVVQPSLARGVHGVVRDDTWVGRFVSSGCWFPRRDFRCGGGGVVVWSVCMFVTSASCVSASASVPTFDLALLQKTPCLRPTSVLDSAMSAVSANRRSLLVHRSCMFTSFASCSEKALYVAVREPWSIRFSRRGVECGGPVPCCFSLVASFGAPC